MNIMKKVAGVMMLALMLMPGTMHAATYYNYGGTTMSQQELINHLYQLIAQLQAQLAGQQHTGGSAATAYGVAAQTISASNIDKTSASLNGSLNLGRASYARVWFDYGTTQSLTERSLTGNAVNAGVYTFRADIVGLKEGQTYYYRAVAEDPAGSLARGVIKSFKTDGDRDYDDDDDRYGDDRPDVVTDDAEHVSETRAELNGEVDMNDFEDGRVFFVYGLDEDLVEEIEDEYETYRDIDEEDEDLRKVEVDRSLDGSRSYSELVTGLEEDETYYFQICVEFENEDRDDEIICGGVEEFDTDEDGRDDDDDDEKPEVTTKRAKNVTDDEAELHGEVGMNDFENGIVFFVFGQDEDLVEEIEDEYDSYSDIKEEGDDLMKYRIDRDLDGRSSYKFTIDGLDDDTDYFFQICVEYDDEDGDETIICGGVEEFTTKD